MNQPTLGLLDKLRPPSGFRTAAALGATYSADLLTCMAVMTTLDGGDGEHVRYGRVEAFRALDRLRDKVRICHQAGRLSRRDGAKYPSLALLDRVLVPVRTPGHGSFHPKVWLVRQVDEESRQRFVLIVSSRNITMSTDWDLGVAVEGVPGGPGVALPRVRAFAEHSLTLAGELGRLDTFGSLDAVRWTLPPHARELAFDFQVGSEGPRRLHRQWDTFPAHPSRALLLSPFIDERMVDEAATRWSHAPARRLVAGTDGLMTVALGSKRDALHQLGPRQVVPASEAAEPTESDMGAENEDEIESVRALHAKAIALDDGPRTIVILGSNNLTSAGWCGGSTEAFVRLVGDPALCEPLWDWAGAHAQLFEFPEVGTPPPKPAILEQLRDELHRARFRLVEAGAHEPSRLLLLDPPILDLPEGVRLDVARYSTPREVVSFPGGATAINFPGCVTALRTHFVVCTLRHDEDQVAWIGTAELEPPISDERDRELVAQLLGLHEFLSYLQSLRADGVVPGPIEGDDLDGSDQKVSRQGQGLRDEGVHLEVLLKQLVTEPAAFGEMDRAVMRYGELIKKGQLSPDELTMFGRFLEAWAAIREAFRA